MQASPDAAPGAAPGDSAARGVARSVGRRATPAERLTAAYNVVLAVVWAALVNRAPYAAPICAAHAAGAVVPWLYRRASDPLSPVAASLRQVYPLIWLIAFWTELDFIRHLLHATPNDPPIAALDVALFGVNIDRVWMPSMPATWFSELMHLLYFAYYPAVLLPLVYMAVAGSAAMKQDIVFRVMLVYLASFAVYMACPVDGPHFIGARYEGALQQGVFYRIVSMLQGAGDSQGCSFPSSHVAASVTMAYLALRWFRRPVAALLAAAAVGVTVSSVYTQNHYAVDVLAGIIWALALQLVVAPALLRWWEPGVRLDQAPGGLGPLRARASRWRRSRMNRPGFRRRPGRRHRPGPPGPSRGGP